MYGWWLLRVLVFFFFKQKTAYEMRISDWSSDVCSSDLRDCLGPEHRIELVDGRPERFCEPALVHLVASSGGLAHHGFRNAARLVPKLGQPIRLGGCRQRVLLRNVRLWWAGSGRDRVCPPRVRTAGALIGLGLFPRHVRGRAERA